MKYVEGYLGSAEQNGTYGTCTTVANYPSEEVERMC